MSLMLNTKEFVDHIESFYGSLIETLKKKNAEYGVDNSPFHNFIVAGTLEGLQPEQALRGMMTKHVVSIYDMLQDAESYSIEQWREKIGDNIVYLLILEAMLSPENS